ncbi:MAG: hypothetical protein JWO09_1048 [Bacteroidetes bacterium]|nr:hypothetical protein [Bacteroidota bacterium]
MDVYNSNKKAGRLGLKRYFNRRLVLAVLLVLIIAGAYKASGFVRGKGYSGLWDFTSTILSNYWKGRSAQPELLSIEIKDKDYKKLQKNREQALERGVIINDMDGDYVPATIGYNGKKIDVKLRLKGHMTDHLQDDKWSFRIKVKEKDETFMGMKRFSIQHPGTRGYVYEWIYHELMKREDVMALRYKFISVSVNGRDWGIYAVEENFENELVENNKRLKGPVLRFNPDLYWVKRYNGMTGANSAAEFASYYSANPEAYREDKVLEDPVQKNYYLKAIALIEGLRSRKVSVDEAFDIPRLARFHAVIDLVGGVHSIDWSDIKYYYNPVTEKLEPVAYESFTELNSHSLSAQYKFAAPDSTANYEDWHSMIFSNPVFFKEYMKNLERLTKPQYLDDFFSSSNTELDKNLAIIYKEFPYKKFDRQDYYKRQRMIRKVLDSPKAVHAYYNRTENNSVVIQLGAIDAMPVQVHSLIVGKQKLLPAKEIILPAKQPGSYLDYKEFKFESGKPGTFSKNDLDSMKLSYSVLGSSDLKQCAVFPFPHTDAEFIADDLKSKKGNVQDFAFLQVDESSKIIAIQPGKYVVTEGIVIPAGYKLVVGAGVWLDFKNKSGIVSYSPLFFTGNEDEQIYIGSSDSSSQGIMLIQAGERSVLRNVTFTDLPEVKSSGWARTGSLTFYESPVDISWCSFYDCKAEDALSMIRSAFSLTTCYFRNMKDDALDCKFSDGTVSGCAFSFCGENALDITMGQVELKSVTINNAGNKAIHIKAGGQLKGEEVKIEYSNIAIAAEDLSTITLSDVKLSDCKTGVVAYKNKSAGGQPQVRLTRVTLTKVQKNYLREKKSLIVVDGVEAGEIVDNVETLIKGDKAEK